MSGYTKLPKIKGYTRADIIAFMKVKLTTDPVWIMHGLKTLFENQTSEEIKKKFAIEDNQKGFSKHDAPFLTRLASKVKTKKFTLTKPEIRMLGRFMEKYAKQLSSLSDPEKLKICLDKYYNIEEK